MITFTKIVLPFVLYLYGRNIMGEEISGQSSEKSILELGGARAVEALRVARGRGSHVFGQSA
jgi:hypothetical protein